MLKCICVNKTGLSGDTMTFNEILTILRDSDINEKVKFANAGMVGYFVKEELGEFVYYDKNGERTVNSNFYLSDFDRDDWEIIK